MSYLYFCSIHITKAIWCCHVDTVAWLCAALSQNAAIINLLFRSTNNQVQHYECPPFRRDCIQICAGVVMKMIQYVFPPPKSKPDRKPEPYHHGWHCPLTGGNTFQYNSAIHMFTISCPPLYDIRLHTALQCG